MKNTIEDIEQERLLEALTIDRLLVPASSPDFSGIGWLLTTGSWYGHSWNVDGFDIEYRNKEGKRHRIYGPAYISKIYDIEMWYKDGLHHREDGPAIRHKMNFWWLKEGKLHRTDGPAIINGGQPKQYWIDGQKYSPKE